MLQPGRGARRNVVWAVGTDYVWVDGEKAEEFYVIKLSNDGDIKKAKVESIVSGVPSRRLVYVENYQIQKNLDLIEAEVNARLERGSDSGGEGSGNSGLFNNNNGSDKTVDSVGITGVILALVAILVGAANFMMVRKLTKAGSNQEQWNEAAV